MMTAKMYNYTVYRPGQKPERGEAKWSEQDNLKYRDIEILGERIIKCREIALIGGWREGGITMVTDAFQPLVSDEDEEEILESLQRHQHDSYTVWSLWDDVQGFARGKYPRNEAATEIYHEWLRAEGYATDGVAIVGTAIMFDKPIWH
jgi:hypothetical protein